MENDDLSKIVRAFDDKPEASSRFFMPDNFYDEKADIINDFEAIKKENFVGDPALRPKDSNSSNVSGVGNNSVNGNVNLGDSKDSDGTNETVFNKLINNSNDGQGNDIDTSKLFNPQFVESSNTNSFQSNLTGIGNFDDSLRNGSLDMFNTFNENNSSGEINGIFDISGGSINKSVNVDANNNNNNNNIDANVGFASTNNNIDTLGVDNNDTAASTLLKKISEESASNTPDINKILNNNLGMQYDTEEIKKEDELYDEKKPTHSEGSSKIRESTLDANFTSSNNTDFVDKTLSSHREFSKLDLGKDIAESGIINDGGDNEISGGVYYSNWQDLPKTTYKASSVKVPVVEEKKYPGVNVKVFNNVTENSDVVDRENDIIVNANANANVNASTDIIDNNNNSNDVDVVDAKNDVQAWINKILRVDSTPVKINSDGSVKDTYIEEIQEPVALETDENYISGVDSNSNEALDIEKFTKKEVDYDFSVKDLPVHKSNLLEALSEQAEKENKISILVRYGEDFCSKDYITNPAIGRSEEIKQLILILLTPEKSGILVGKPGIGKTSIVEGLAYQLQRDNVPDALKGYTIVNVKTASLLGTLPSGETRLQTLVDELKAQEKVILFIDEIHMLIGSTNESALDFANMFKEGLGRGKIKVIGATTTEEYERYILRDKAFVRRFQKVEVEEPSREHTIRILIGTLPKIEKTTNAKLKYDGIVQSRIMGFIVDITSEYKRVYGIGSRYPDICLTLLSQAFSQAVFDDRKEVNIFDIRNAIENSKNIYPDVIRKELVKFDKMFENVIREEQGLPPLENIDTRY